MITDCIAYLEGKLRAAMGEETAILSTAKELAQYADSHMGGILLERDLLSKSGVRCGPNGDVRLYNRALQFSVVMGEYTLEALDPMYITFLGSLDASFALSDGRYAALELGEVEWTAKDDSILLANVAALIPVTITGGIYKPRQTAVIKHTTISIEEESSSGSKTNNQ